VLSSSTIEPGAEGTIKTAVDTKGRRGHLKKSVTVQTDQPGVAPVHLVIEVGLEDL